MSIGSELKHAREREGLSAEQIAERTKVPLYKIEALEDGRFENLPDDIYLDGIIRAYAREIAVDPEPLVRRGRQERGAGPDSWAIDFDGLNGVLKNNAPVHDPIVHEPVDTPLRPSGGFISPAHFRAPHDNAGASRTVKMAFVLIAALAVAGWGAYFNERSHRSDRIASAAVPPAASIPAQEAPQPTVPSPQTETPPPNSRAQTNQSTSNRDATATAGVNRPVAPPRSTQPPTTSTPPAASPAPATSTAAAKSTGAATSTAPPAPEATLPNTPQATPNAAPAASTRDVSGAWNFTTHVESSAVEAFSGLQLGYTIQLTQSGDRVHGTGRKMTENGTAIGSQAQTPITMDGTIKGDRLTLTFTETGTQRESQGKFVLLADEGTLRGRFSSTAAQSSGTVEAHRAAGAR